MIEGGLLKESWIEVVKVGGCHQDLLVGGNGYQKMGAVSSVKLGQDVVQQQHRAFPCPLKHEPGFGELHGERHHTLLAP